MLLEPGPNHRSHSICRYRRAPRTQTFRQLGSEPTNNVQALVANHLVPLRELPIDATFGRNEIETIHLDSSDADHLWYG